MGESKTARFTIHQDVVDTNGSKEQNLKDPGHWVNNHAKKANDLQTSKSSARAVLGTITNTKQNRSGSQLPKALTCLTSFDQSLNRPSIIFPKKIHVCGYDGFTTSAKENPPSIYHHPKGCNKPIAAQENDECDMESLSSTVLTPYCADIAASPMDASSEPEDSKAFESSLYGRILNVSDYTADIFEYLKLKEINYMPPVNHLNRQPDVTMTMRCILVDWLVEVAEEYHLHRETLCLSINYVDRFLSEMAVIRGKLQLVGAAAMLIASKYEEIYPPDVQEFVYITDDTYTKKQLVKMERLILRVLQFNLTAPTIHIFLEWFLKQIHQTEQEQMYHLSMYIMELVLVHGELCCQFPPSKIAAVSLYISGVALDCNLWCKSMKLVSGYGMEELDECLKCVYSVYKDASYMKQQAVQDKYKLLKFKEVAYLPVPELNL